MAARKTKSVAERRAPDQDAALEAAFESGALPEADRRATYEWVARGDGVKQLYRNGQLCHEIPEADRDHVSSLLEE